VLRRIFLPKMEEVVGGWRRLHDEELQKILTGDTPLTCIYTLFKDVSDHASLNGKYMHEPLNSHFPYWCSHFV
jgi:hypothetical protein